MIPVLTKVVNKQKRIKTVFQQMVVPSRPVQHEENESANSVFEKELHATVVSLFSGCGGMDLGFVGGFDFLNCHYQRNAFDIIWANEINPAACSTYRENFGAHIVEGDIREVFDKLPNYADVVVGGFPCQDISINGKMAGSILNPSSHSASPLLCGWHCCQQCPIV